MWRVTVVTLPLIVFVMAACGERGPDVVPTDAGWPTTGAGAVAGDAPPPRRYWTDVSDDSLWQYITAVDTTVTVGLKAPGTSRGYYHGEWRIAEDAFHRSVADLRDLGGLAVQAIHSQMPVVRVLIQRRADLHRLRQLPSIDYVEPAYLRIRLASGGCSPNYGSEILSGDSLPKIFWGMRIPAAWRYSKGSGKTIAMIDTGIDTSQGELFPDWTALTISGTNDDWHGHGTHQAGAIGAPMNGTNIVGAAHGSTRLSVRHGHSGTLGRDYYDVDTWRMVAALDTAQARDADVITMALSSDDGSNQVSDKMEDLYALDDVLLFGAAGSASNFPGSQDVVFPANHPDVIAVAAVDYDTNLRSECSHPGPDVELAGYHGMTTTGHTSSGETTYGESSNTSNATSLVAAIATLVRARYPNYSNGQVRQLLQQTAQDVSEPGVDNQTGYGVVDAYAAMDGPEWDVTINGQMEVPPGTPCTWSVSGLNGVSPYTIRWYTKESASGGFQYVGSGQQITSSLSVHPTYLKVQVTDTYHYRAVDVAEIHLSEEASCPQ